MQNNLYLPEVSRLVGNMQKIFLKIFQFSVINVTITKILSLTKFWSGSFKTFLQHGLILGLCPHACPVLARIPQPKSDHPGLPLARILLGQFIKNFSYPWCLLLVTFHPLTPVPNLLLSNQSPLVLAIFIFEPSSIVWSLFLYCNISWINSVFIILTTIHF